eukprot:scaffold36285_cov119-Isochrysis_galbana.AAC.4
MPKPHLNARGFRRSKNVADIGGGAQIVQHERQRECGRARDLRGGEWPAGVARGSQTGASGRGEVERERAKRAAGGPAPEGAARPPSVCSACGALGEQRGLAHAHGHLLGHPSRRENPAARSRKEEPPCGTKRATRGRRTSAKDRSWLRSHSRLQSSLPVPAAAGRRRGGGEAQRLPGAERPPISPAALGLGRGRSAACSPGGSVRARLACPAGALSRQARDTPGGRSHNDTGTLRLLCGRERSMGTREHETRIHAQCGRPPELGRLEQRIDLEAYRGERLVQPRPARVAAGCVARVERCRLAADPAEGRAPARRQRAAGRRAHHQAGRGGETPQPTTGPAGGGCGRGRARDSLRGSHARGDHRSHEDDMKTDTKHKTHK